MTFIPSTGPQPFSTLRIQNSVPQLGHLSHETNSFVGHNFCGVVGATRGSPATRKSLGMASVTYLTTPSA